MRFEPPEAGVVQYLWAFFLQLRDRLILARCPQVAASLAFTTLLALVPLLMIGLVVFSSVPAFSGIFDSLKIFLLQNLLPEKAGQIIATYALQFSQNATRLTLIGTSIVVVTAVVLIMTIDRAFNQIWAVAHPRRLLARLSIYWVSLTIGPMALAAVVALLGQLAALSLGLLPAPEQWLRTGLARATTLLVLSALFSLMYLGLPNRPVRIAHAVLGGLLAALLLTLLQRLLALYLASFPTYTLVYGTFAALPIFLLWLYLSWLAVLVGAAIVAVLPDVALRGRPRPPFAGNRLLGALQLIDALAAAQARAVTPHIEALARSTDLGLAETSTLLEDLVQAGWVASTESGRWVLTTRSEDLRLHQLVEALCISPDGLRNSRHALGMALATHVEKLRTTLGDPVSALLAEARKTTAKP